jgi:hypothetical protein
VSFAKRMQGVATKLLSKYDESDGRIVLVRQGVPVWDETAGEMLPGLAELIPLVGVTVPVDVRLIDGTNIQAGDVVAKVTSATEPTTADKLEFEGTQWSIVGVTPSRYTDTTIMYNIQARR